MTIDRRCGHAGQISISFGESRYLKTQFAENETDDENETGFDLKSIEHRSIDRSIGRYIHR